MRSGEREEKRKCWERKEIRRGEGIEMETEGWKYRRGSEGKIGRET